MKGIISLFMALYCCLTGIVSTVDIRVNSEKYNYSDVPYLENIPECPENADVDDFVQLDNVNMHYLKFGNGSTPLVFIHGNGGGTWSLYSVGGRFSEEYTVYIIEERCHGQSTDTDEITYELMADDVFEFCNAMQLKNPVLIGHSDGGIVAIQSAADHPDYYGGIVSMGANSHPESAWFQFRFWVKWKNLFGKDKLNDLMLNGPDFSEELLSNITCPAYIVSGDADLMPVQDTLYIHENIKGSDIIVIKGENHSSYVDDSEKAYSLIYPWLQSKGL